MTNSVAVTTFVDDNPQLIEEFGWLYRSWIYSGCSETSDLVVFCAGVKDKLVDDENIIYVDLCPLSKTDSLWANYKFINSIHYLTTPIAEKVLKDYDYILRTDNDVFLTHNFKDLKPRLPMFGVGGYVRNREVAEKLMMVATKLKLNYCFFHNVGSTIFYKTKGVIIYSKQQLNLCCYLMHEEFKEDFGN